ncbi:hypothetical protein CPB85DRAFT_1430032 [Mucidula mucida]|nr:hypothetical protein CPB85DRAFT_1430032 [Mucidula mucida]
MGHTQSSLFGDVSIETVGTVVVVAAAASFAVVQLSSPAAASSQASGSLVDKSKTLKKKPKAKGKAKDEQEKVSEVVKVAPAAAEAIPGDFDAPMVDIAVTAPEVSPATTTKKKSKGKKKKAAAASANESQASDASVGASSKPSGDSPAPKPPVAAPVSPPPPQVASLPSETLESTASESDELRVSLASQTGANTPTRSTASESSNRPVPAAGFSWGDYEDAHHVEDDDEGWGVVQRSRGTRNTNTIIPATANKPATPSNQPLTKKQRQNAAKRAAQKDAKVDAEKERLAALQKHKRDLEKTRMAEQASGTGKGKVSGGMKASVDDNGKLVWE